jgi:AraC-like DNA-binding protein
MAVLIDTAEMPAGERVDAVHTAMIEATAPSYDTHEAPARGIRMLMEQWFFGDTRLVRVDSTGFRLLRTPKQARQDIGPSIALSVQTRATVRHVQYHTEQSVPEGGMILADISGSYDFSWSGRGGCETLHVPIEQLGLSVEVVQRAMTGVTHSPLYGLMVDHVRRLAADAERLAADTSAPDVGAATTDLARALLVSAGRADGRQARRVLADTLLTRVRAYVRAHLGEPGLSPESIAAAHNVSVRYLYKVCAQADFSLRQWIITERLRRARAELADPAATGRTVANIARRWGFTDPTHFGRRFRSEYHVTPGEWRRQNLGPIHVPDPLDLDALP